MFGLQSGEQSESLIKRQAQELRFMTQQKLHSNSVRSTGTATAILMSPDPPVLREKQCCQIMNKVHIFMNILPFVELFYELQSICELSMNFCQVL